jgi:uncharacterized OsmC-like protein
MKVTKEKIVNGVDVEKLRENIGALKENPALANFKFRVNNRWVRAGHNHTTIKNFFGLQKDIEHEKPFELDAGEHQVLLSEDEGPNPVEYLLTAIVSCVTSALVYHAAAKGIEVKGVESRVEGDIDLRGFLGISPDVKVGYKQIRLYFKIDADISDEQKEELIRMGEKFSPVRNSVTAATPVSAQLEK